MTISNKIKALQIWNGMTPMQRVNVMREAGVLGRDVKVAFNKSLDLIERQLNEKA